MVRSADVNAGADVAAVLLAVTLGAFAPCKADGNFDRVYEPSGLAALADGTLIVLDDEKGSPLHHMRIERQGAELSLTAQTVIAAPAGITARWRMGALDDLEGACLDGDGRVLTIGSHNTDAGIDDTDRRKVVRFRVEHGRMQHVQTRRDLRQDLLDALPAIREAMRTGGKHDDHLDIEALACDRRRGRLLIGLRSPRHDDRAIIVALTNPDAWFGGGVTPRFEEPARTLDLDKGGIRAMAYDDAADALLIVSRRESGKGGRFKAWWQDAAFAHEPVRVTLADRQAFDDVEGVAVLDDGSGVMFVRDDGDRGKRRTGSWFFATRRALDLPGSSGARPP